MARSQEIFTDVLRQWVDDVIGGGRYPRGVSYRLIVLHGRANAQAIQINTLLAIHEHCHDVHTNISPHAALISQEWQREHAQPITAARQQGTLIAHLSTHRALPNRLSPAKAPPSTPRERVVLFRCSTVAKV
jgi:hypothetical protein